MFTAISAKIAASCASGLVALAAAASATLAGDVSIQAGPVEITLGMEDNRGMVMKIEGVDCPGAGCPGLALNWDALKRG